MVSTSSFSAKPLRKTGERRADLHAPRFGERRDAGDCSHGKGVQVAGKVEQRAGPHAHAVQNARAIENIERDRARTRVGGRGMMVLPSEQIVAGARLSVTTHTGKLRLSNIIDSHGASNGDDEKGCLMRLTLGKRGAPVRLVEDVCDFALSADLQTVVTLCDESGELVMRAFVAGERAQETTEEDEVTTSTTSRKWNPYLDMGCVRH
eukprot:6207895-Pleurochrysis_carterae.AAC.1